MFIGKLSQVSIQGLEMKIPLKDFVSKLKFCDTRKYFESVKVLQRICQQYWYFFVGILTKLAWTFWYQGSTKITSFRDWSVAWKITLKNIFWTWNKSAKGRAKVHESQKLTGNEINSNFSSASPERTKSWPQINASVHSCNLFVLMLRNEFINHFYCCCLGSFWTPNKKQFLFTPLDDHEAPKNVSLFLHFRDDKSRCEKSPSALSAEFSAP